MSQKFHHILIVGATGQLGSYLVSSGLFGNILTPTRKILNLCDTPSIKKYFQAHSFDAIIHTAAIARMRDCQKDPVSAMQTNLMGTCRLVEETLRKEKKMKKKIRYLYVSTDGVYPSTRGPYKESDPAIPYNHYGWTKLGAECAVHLLKDHCIIRTRFHDPAHIPFKIYAKDSFNSSLPLNELAHAIHTLLYSRFIGTVNVGSKKSSDYARYKKLKTAIRPCQLKDIQSKTPFILSRNASLDCSLWKKIIRTSSHVS